MELNLCHLLGLQFFIKEESIVFLEWNKMLDLTEEDILDITEDNCVTIRTRDAEGPLEIMLDI